MISYDILWVCDRMKCGALGSCWLGDSGCTLTADLEYAADLRIFVSVEKLCFGDIEIVDFPEGR